MRRLAVIASLLVLGCGNAGVAVDAARPIDASAHDSGPRPDAYVEDAPVVFDDGGACGALEIGRCGLVDGGLCVGAPDEPAVFVPMVSGDPVPLVTGPQGASMFVLGVRTRGIDPGEPSMPASRTNPTVEIHVLDAAGTELAVYRGRTTFAPDGADPTLLVQPHFFVVTDGAARDLVGTLSAVASLYDATGATRCGTLAFTPSR